MAPPKSHLLPADHVLRAIKRDYPPDPSTGPFLRAFAVGWGISLGPEILKNLIALVLLRSKGGDTSTTWSKLRRVLLSGFAPRSFALFLGLVFGGGRYLERLLRPLVVRVRRERAEKARTGDERQVEARATQAWTTFASSTVATLAALLLYQSEGQLRRPRASVIRPVPFDIPASPRKQPRSSPTLDLTLFALVRAVDTAGRALHARHTPRKGSGMAFVAEHADVLVFWVSCWRIMWCWFYDPRRLPPAYVAWITRLARMDTRLLKLLREAKANRFVYGQIPSADVDQMCQGIADNMRVPADICLPHKIEALPCHVVHGQLGNSNSCEVATFRRWIAAWSQSMRIYLPVHAIPRLLFSRQRLLAAPLDTLTSTLIAAARSSAFLATFVASIWASICLARTRLGPRLLPSIPQQSWDGGLAPLLGCMACGLSVLIENKRRRGEMALYVAPRALYAVLDEVLPSALFKGDVGRVVGRWSERAILSFSMGVVTTAAVHEPEMVRGVVRGVLSFLVGRSWAAEGRIARGRRL